MNASSSHAHSHEQTVPRPALIAAAVLVFGTMAMTGAVRLGYLDREAVPSAVRAKANIAAVSVRELAFADRADGAVVITDAATGAPIRVIETETQSGGFIRGVLRGMARERRSLGIGAEPAFRLTLWADGSLSLNDLATQRTIELGAFGPDNREVFMTLLEPGAA